MTLAIIGAHLQDEDIFFASSQIEQVVALTLFLEAEPDICPPDPAFSRRILHDGPAQLLERRSYSAHSLQRIFRNRLSHATLRCKMPQAGIGCSHRFLFGLCCSATNATSTGWADAASKLSLLSRHPKPSAGSFDCPIFIIPLPSRNQIQLPVSEMSACLLILSLALGTPAGMRRFCEFSND